MAGTIRMSGYGWGGGGGVVGRQGDTQEEEAEVGCRGMRGLGEGGWERCRGAVWRGWWGWCFETEGLQAAGL